MAGYLINLVNLIAWLITAVLFLDALVSFVLEPWHPARRFLDRLAEPFVRPLRQLLPPVGMLDFSVMAALIIVQVASQLLIMLIAAVF